jgi:hypothetical protein
MLRAAYLRLQDPLAVSANLSQAIQFAADCGQYSTVVVQVRRIGAAPTAGSVQMQHAAVNTDDQYEDIGTAVDLTQSTPKTIVLTGHSRFLRWKTTAMNGSATFQIDIIARF